MLDHIQLNKILFLDIETVPQWPSYDGIPADFKILWEHKADSLKRTPDETAETLYRKAGIYAEFSKIICISAAYFHAGQLRVKSFAGDDEKELLSRFAVMVNQFFRDSDYYLAAHNGKEFDFPVIARRMLVNGLSLPKTFSIAGRKPWEIAHIDTMELWKFGDYKSFTSLALLATLFGLPTPKDDINGSEVASVYWIEHDLPRIVKYCQKDTVTVARLFQKYRGEAPVPESDIVIVGDSSGIYDS